MEDSLGVLSPLIRPYLVIQCITTVRGDLVAKEAVVQVRMDSDVKARAEAVYQSIGTSLAEAIRVFAVQSIYANGYPFQPRAARVKGKSNRGRLADYVRPELQVLEKDAFADAMRQKHGR